EERLAHLREENARSFVRPSQSLTPPGSARALDEPPPLLDGPLPEPTGRSTTELVRATAIERVIEVQRFNGRAVPEDLEPSTRRRGLLLGGVTVVGVLVVGATLLGVYHRANSGDGQSPAGELAAAAAPAQPAPAVPPPAPAARAQLDVQP